MEIKISFEEVKSNHPELVDLMIEKIRNAKSKDKEKGIENCEWFYSYGIAVRGMSFNDMLGDIIKPGREEKKSKSTQEIVSERLKSVLGLSLVISIGRLRRYHIFPDNDKPKLFVDKFFEVSQVGIDSIKEEENRLSKLTKEEKDREIQEHINELSDMGGFAGFNIGPNGIKKIEPQPIEYNMDDVLDKIGRVGMDGLTKGEKEFLKNESA